MQLRDHQQEGRPNRAGAIVLFVLGVLGTTFLCWNMLDGVIYIHGDGVARSSHPVAFWIIASLMACLFINCIYWAVRKWRNGKQSQSR
jgi:H+/Cl- antiporter ClcA